MLTMVTTYVVQVRVGTAWVDDPAQKDRGSAEAARAYVAAKPGETSPAEQRNNQ
jgi:hypothetical protein